MSHLLPPQVVAKHLRPSKKGAFYLNDQI